MYTVGSRSTVEFNAGHGGYRTLLCLPRFANNSVECVSHDDDVLKLTFLTFLRRINLNE